MTPEQIGVFLREPRVSMLATVQPDGSPHVTPVWHHYDGNRLYVCAGESTVKVRNIRQEPRVSLLVTTLTPPHMYVLVHGSATLSHDRIPELVMAMSLAYKGHEEGRKHAERVLREVRFIAIAVEPSRMVSTVIR